MDETEEKYICNTTVFDEDEVCRLTSANKYVYGLVVESSEYLSSDEDDDETPGRLHRGTVRVAWHPDGKETVVDENKIVLADRSLMPGDVVRRMIKNSQRGFIQDMDVRCHLHILGTDKYIYNVGTKDLLSAQAFDPEPGEVTMDSWVGRIETINEEFRLSFPDGAMCTMTDADISMLEDADDKRDKNSAFAVRDFFYEGQILKGTMEDLSDVKWIHSTSNYNSKAVTSNSAAKQTVFLRIDEVFVKSLQIHWLCRGFAKVENPQIKMDSPNHYVNKSELHRIQMLDLFQHCNKQIGDKAFYKIKDTDVLVETPPKKTFIPDIVSYKEGQTLPSKYIPKSSKNQEPVNAEGNLEDLQKTESLNKNHLDHVEGSDTEVKLNGDIDDMDHLGETESRTMDECQSESSVIKENKNTCCKPGVSDNAAASEQCESKDDEEYEDIEDSDKDSECSSVASSQSGNVSPFSKKRKSNKKGPALKTKQMKKMKGRKSVKHLKFDDQVLECKAGDKVPVEIAYTYSTACVMWQNGEVEDGVPSPELFPIHHLDELEFFPGDFLVDSKESTQSHDYGVVLSCDHQARTCMVKWMKTVDISKGEKPDESVVPEEVSVYDIKDHPDFKFRPGQTVIRVGEPENVTDDTPAVGQIHKLDPQGVIYVKWPGITSMSQCYPQELYIVGDEMSEFDSLSDSSDWETEEEEELSDSNEEWETENEEEIDEDKSDQDVETDSELQCKSSDVDKLFLMGKTKKEELDGLLQRAQTALRKLEDIFQNFEGKLQDSFQCYQDIITIYRKCRDLEKILKSSYFEDPEIVELIEEIRRELRKEKSKKINKHLLEVYESRKSQGQKSKVTGFSELTNRLEKVQLSDTKVNDETASPVCGISGHDLDGMDSGFKSDSSAESTVAQKCDRNNVCDNGMLSHATNGGINNTGENLVTGATNFGGDVNFKKSLSEKIKSKEGNFSGNIQDNSLNLCNGKPVSESVTGEENEDGKLCKAGNHNDENNSGKTCSAISKSKSESDSGVDKDLCFKICKQLHVRMKNIQKEMDKRWQKAEKATLRQQRDDTPSTNIEENMTCLHQSKVDIDKDMTTLQSGVETHDNIVENTTSLHQPEEGTFSSNVAGNANDTCLEKLPSLSEIELDGTNLETKVCPAAEGGINDSSTLEAKFGSLGAEDKISVNEDNSQRIEGTSFETKDESQVVESDVEIEESSLDGCCKGFHLQEEVPLSHKFLAGEQASGSKTFMNAVMKELKLLQTSLPEGIVVKAFENRMDLYSVMIVGPAKTPYEDGLFFFDVYLPVDYPGNPPELYYISYCSDRLNPNLYDDGKVCVSLLGTWGGKGNEMWTQNSNLLQVLISIQGLILVAEPYYNEAGYEKQRGTQQGHENSKMYNEMAVLKMIQSLTCMVKNPPLTFKDEVKEYQLNKWPRLIQRIENWIMKSSQPSLLPSSQKESTDAKQKKEDGPSQFKDNKEDTKEIADVSQDPNTVQNHTDKSQESYSKHCCESDVKKSLGDTAHDHLHDNPEFPLLPASRGFCLTVKKHVELFRKTLSESCS